MPIDAGIDERKYLNQALEKCIKYLRIKELWFEEVLYKAWNALKYLRLEARRDEITQVLGPMKRAQNELLSTRK